MAIYSEEQQQLLQASIISRIYFSFPVFPSDQVAFAAAFAGGCGSKSVLFYFISLHVPERELH